MSPVCAATLLALLAIAREAGVQAGDAAGARPHRSAGSGSSLRHLELLVDGSGILFRVPAGSNVSVEAVDPETGRPVGQRSTLVTEAALASRLEGLRDVIDAQAALLSQLQFDLERKTAEAELLALVTKRVERMLEPESVSALARALDGKADKTSTLPSNACACVSESVVSPDCGALPIGLNAVACSDTRHTGSTCEVTCAPGFTGKPASFKCNLLGRWEGTIDCVSDKPQGPPEGAVYQVTGAGTSIVNGYYKRFGTNDGRPQFGKVTAGGETFKDDGGNTVWLGFSGGYGWHGYTWTLAVRITGPTGGVAFDGIYYNPVTTKLPPASGWRTCQDHSSGCGGESEPHGNGEEPLPTITLL